MQDAGWRRVMSFRGVSLLVVCLTLMAASCRDADRGGNAEDECMSDDECLFGHCDIGVSCAGIGCPTPPPNECTVCGDGSELRCRRAQPPCDDGLVPEIINGCFGQCVDRYTCEARKPGTCNYDGVVYDVGDSFAANDGCNACSCVEGGIVACTLKACIAPDAGL